MEYAFFFNSIYTFFVIKLRHFVDFWNVVCTLFKCDIFQQRVWKIVILACASAPLVARLSNFFLLYVVIIPWRKSDQKTTKLVLLLVLKIGLAAVSRFTIKIFLKKATQFGIHFLELFFLLLYFSALITLLRVFRETRSLLKTSSIIS